MRVLIVGVGVIGTVYGAHLAATGNQVSALSLGPRTDEVAVRGGRDIQIVALKASAGPGYAWSGRSR